jgi:hypothetical protein
MASKGILVSRLGAPWKGIEKEQKRLDKCRI